MCSKFVLVLLLVNYASSDLVCPTSPITKDSGLKGVIPNGAARNNIVPANTNCTFRFTNPKGFAIKFAISSTYDVSLKDDLILHDANGDKYRIVSPATGLEEWGAATEVSLQVIGTTGKSTFYVEYSYVDVSGYQQSKLASGEYRSLNFTNNFYYTWVSAKNDSVAISPGRRNTKGNEPVIYNTFVYDGPDIVNSKFLGRLSSVSVQNSITPSTGSSITLVNFFQTTSNSSYVLGNDVTPLIPFSKYLVVITSSNTVTSGELKDFSDSGAGYTFICIDCDNLYLTKLTLMDPFTTGYIQFTGMSPTHGLPSPLTYYTQSFLYEQLPQVIPASMFTMKLYLTGVGISVTTDNGSWLKAYDKREAVVFNPLLWNPNGKNSFDYTFSFDENNKLMKYNVSLDQMNFNGTDSLRLTIGDGKSSNVDNTYPKTASSSKFVVGNGKQASLKYQNGVATSSIQATIRMNIVQSSTFLGTILSTLVPFMLVLKY